MDITIKSTKAEMLAEITRLRAELDEARKPAQRRTPRVDREPLIARMRELSLKYKTTCRLNGDTIQLYSRKRREWRDVPADA